MHPRNIAALALILASFGLLVPGVVLPALSIDISPVLPFLGRMNLLQETRSILGTVRKLYETGDWLVASLILAFSVVVPACKGLALLYVLALPRAPWRRPLYGFVSLIGKWSMADVFVMGLFLTFLAGNAATGISARLHQGFWFFLGYCILSVLSAQLMRVEGMPAPGEAAFKR